MQAEVERTLRNLCIIASLSQNDKLMTENEHFAVYTPTIARGFCRKWYGEGRDLNTIRIHETVRSAILYIHNIQDGEHVDANAPIHGMENAMKAQHCRRMTEALRNSVRGLENLQATYRDDFSMLSKLKVLIDEIQDFQAVSQRRVEFTQSHTQAIVQ